MRKLLVPLIAALALLVPPAHADRGYHGRGGHGYHGGSGHHGSISPWAGLAVFGALAGLAILAESSRPVYVDPHDAWPADLPQPIVGEGQPEASAAPGDPAGNWYYCGSSAMYYPYTRECPEGWQTVPARPS